MVPRKLRIRHFKALHRATICLQPGTTIESSLADHFRANNIAFQPLAIARTEDVRTAYLAGRCDAVTADFSTLHAMLATNPQQTHEHLILSQSIAKTPYSPAVRQGDAHIANVVRWAVYAMIEAEELGITSGNVDEILKRDNAAIRRLLGETPGIGKALGVHDKWVYNVIKQVGNYGESYDRNLGNSSPLKISRSPTPSGQRAAFSTRRPSADRPRIGPENPAISGP